MPLYIGDYLADTGRLTTEGHGAYLLMLMDYWRTRRPLPDDDEQLGAITKLGAERFRKLRPILMHFFCIQDGCWLHSNDSIGHWPSWRVGRRVGHRRRPREHGHLWG